MEKDQNNVSSTNQTAALDRVVVFHASIFILGGFLIMPVILAGPLSGVMEDMSYLRLAIFSCITLAPVSIAFGTELKFSLSRFIYSAAAIAFISFAQGVRYSKGGPFLVPLAGGGLIGLGVAFATGFSGMKVYDLMRRYFTRRIWIAFGLIVSFSIGLYIYSEIQRGRFVHMPIEQVMNMTKEERRSIEDNILVKGTGNIVQISTGSRYKIVIDLPVLQREMVILAKPGKEEYLSSPDAMDALEIGDTVEFRGLYYPSSVVYTHEFAVLAESRNIKKVNN